MSFTTGAAQRRGLRSATRGSSRSHVGQTPFPEADRLRQPAGQFRATTKRRRTASIGADDATGLVIHGSHEIDTMEGTDPDGASPPISGDTLANPDFPITYTGRGTMRFMSPIRIASIDGPLNVNGQVYSSEGLLGGIPDDTASWESTLAVGATGAGANFTVDAANTYATYIRTRDNVSLHVHYTWTDKGSVADGSAIFIKGIPFTVEAQVHKTVIHPTGVTATQLGSYFIVKAEEDATEFEVLSADSATGTEVSVTGAECAAAGTISFLIQYHGVIP